MERLVTTAQAAKILGISLQGVHYRIKTKKLKSIKQASRTYVYIDNSLEETPVSKHKSVEIQTIVDVKNEQIKFLKKHIKTNKKEHKKEIKRLVLSYNTSINVLNSEVKLLQNAFNEMRNIYKNKPLIKQIVPKKESISVEMFFVKLRNYKKSNKEIKQIIVKAIKNRDKRFIYNRKSKILLIENTNFDDIL